MNRAINKRWGKKLLLFFCVIISFLCVITIPNIYNKEVKAETTAIDDSPLGISIDYIDNNYLSGTYYAISKTGYVYAWGVKSDDGQLGDGDAIGREDSKVPKPVKVADDPENPYLNDVIKVRQGGAQTRDLVVGHTSFAWTKPFAIALKRDGTVYGWGDNNSYALGLEEKIYPSATKLDIDFKVKDIAVSGTATFLISEDGELYVSGTDSYGNTGIGYPYEDRYVIKKFTKITHDINGEILPKLKRVESLFNTGTVLLSENGELYGTGYTAGIGCQEKDTYITKFAKSKTQDGTATSDFADIYPSYEASGHIVKKEDGVTYISNTYNTTVISPGFLPVSDTAYNGVKKLNDPDGVINNIKYLKSSNRLAVITNEGRPYIGDLSVHYFQKSSAEQIALNPYIEGDIDADYNHAKMLFSAFVNREIVLLSESGSIYINGKKIKIGEISINGTNASSKKYESNEKYNNDIKINLDDTLVIPVEVNVKTKDLIKNTENISKMGESTITVNAKDERVYQEYTFYFDGQEDQGETFVVDLYKHTPETSDLTNNGTYKVGKTISFTDNVLPNNTVTATLSKNGGTATAFTSGTAINDEGSYSLVLKDLYGNTNTYAFKISNAESAESISFTKSSAGNLIVGNTITKIGNVVGTISLNYPYGVTPSTIDSMTIDQTDDGSNFEVYGKDGLKVITKDLEAREYVVSVSGTDANGLAFSGTIKFTVEKIPLSLEIQLKNKNQVYQSSVTYQLGEPKPIERIQIVGSSTLDLSTLGTPIFSYEKDGKTVASPMNETGTYTVSASYPTGTADNYDITWTNATLIVEDLIIDESNLSNFVKLESDGKPYTQGTWTNKDIIITPVHSVFSLMDVDHAGAKSSAPYTYSEEGEHSVKLSFYTSEGAEVSTDVVLKYDQTAPTITNFVYEDETTLRSIMRTITFDHYFGKAQQLSFTGSDETGGSGLDHYRYEIVELDKDKNEKPASKKTGTLGLNEKLNLNINTSYRISAWAIDTAGNESDEKIERVFLSDEVAQLNITATSDGKAYDGSKWVSKPIDITLSGTSSAGVSKYQYSEDGVIFHDLAGNTITLPDPLEAMNNTLYTFRAINLDGTESEQVFYLKVDPVKPTITVKGSVNGTDYDGSATDQSVILTPSQTNQSISGINYYYTTNPSSKNGDPLTDPNWKKYSSPITHSVNGTYTYYFKAISGAGIYSELAEFTVNLNKKEYTDIQVNVTTEGKDYSPGNWAKHDITFTLSGGMKDVSQITGYEYTTTSGAKPNASANWKSITDETLVIEENVMDRTYWFRVLPSDPDYKTSNGIQVMLDVDKPTVPVLTMKYENTNTVAQLINLFSFGSWMNKQAVVTMKSTDETSGLDHYEYEEQSNTNTVPMKSKNGIIRYGDETEIILRARACDQAGNCSEYGDSKEVKVDMKAPTIIGVKDQSIYVQYYLPRFVSVKDDLSGIAMATYTKTGGSAIDIIGETKIEGEGTYQVYAKDEAGNEVTLLFKIVRLPDIETEIDGSDESRNIIDQVIEELEENRKKLDLDEIEEYERWISEAEEKWDASRRKVIETEDKVAKVEGQGDTNFDPNTELIVEEIPKDKVPVLPRNAIKTYGVYLKKGNTVIQPDGSVKVYLPYTEEEPPIVYEIGEDGSVKEMIAIKEGDYVTFITNTLKKYAISNELQKENKPEPEPTPNPKPDEEEKNVCVIGPDHKLETNDDVCGSEDSTKNPDGSVDVPNGGTIHFPDVDLEVPDGAHINPDGSVVLPDGTEYNPDGSKKDQDDINKDTDNDGKPDVNIDIDGNGKPDINIDVDGDGVPDINIDTNGDGKPDYNIDTDGDQKPDVNVGPKPKPWKPNTCHTVNKVDYCTMEGLKPNINIDTNKDGIPDLNVDLNGDGSADLNIDTDFDNIPNINIDSTGDGKPDINVDRTGNGKADENIQEVITWNPKDIVTVNGKTYGIMKSLYREPSKTLEPDTSDPTPSTDDNQTNNPQPSVKGNYQSNVGGASTGDTTKWYVWAILVILSLCTLGYTLYKKHKQI